MLQSIVVVGLLIPTGCIIAPIPLKMKESREVWHGVGETGQVRSIQLETTQGYFPVVASSDGPQKWLSGGMKCEYFLVDGRGSEALTNHLAHLDMVTDAKHFTEWNSIRKIENTGYWVAMRLVWPEPKSTNSVSEAMVFNRQSARHTHRMSIKHTSYQEGFRSAWYDPNERFYYYNSFDGVHQWDIVNNLDVKTNVTRPSFERLRPSE